MVGNGCLKPLSTILHLCRGGEFYWLWKPQYLENNTNLPEVTEIFEHTRLYRVHLVTRVRRSQQIKPYNRDRQCKLSIRRDRH